MQNIRFSMDSSDSGTYQPVSRSSSGNGQKAVTAMKNIHHDRSAPPSMIQHRQRDRVAEKRAEQMAEQKHPHALHEVAG